jgi:hypothetical protein
MEQITKGRGLIIGMNRYIKSLLQNAPIFLPITWGGEGGGRNFYMAYCAKYQLVNTKTYCTFLQKHHKSTNEAP